MKTNPPTILVSRCFSEVTPESAENGDTSDYGFVDEREAMTFSELVRAIRDGGFYQDGSTGWLSTGYYTEDYRTGTEREETLHFHRDNPKHLDKWFWLAARMANRKAVQS
jgi:uncharacterized GH25 family protein